jgi:hypothetical protein
MNYYETDPQMREYFDSLPVSARTQLVESGVIITTLGELKQAAEHLMK